ncbi:MAG: hypothetical protein Q8P41_21700 [Pseudomonadota bacterium]|nr:hypothetical protein [Pseudomonadota bacterium]
MLLLLLSACFGVSFGDPCADYCDYVCECHEGEASFDCDQCRTENSGTDAELQDACESSLTDLQADDEAAGTGCSTAEGEDTGL